MNIQAHLRQELHFLKPVSHGKEDILLSGWHQIGFEICEPKDTVGRVEITSPPILGPADSDLLVLYWPAFKNVLRGSGALKARHDGPCGGLCSGSAPTGPNMCRGTCAGRRSRKPGPELRPWVTAESDSSG